jgi:hypothetical protein
MCVPVGDANALADALRHVTDGGATDLVAEARRRAQDFTWSAAAGLLWRLHLRFAA